MRVVILSSGLYSETACATAAQLSQAGFTPTGAIALSTLNRQTLLRKVGQLGVREVLRFAQSKLAPRRANLPPVGNSYLHPYLTQSGKTFRGLREVAAFHNFPIALCANQNSPSSLARLRAWQPDLIIFSGGNLLRRDLLQIPRFGVLNIHLGLLPEIRGMSSPEWSLLSGVPVGITFHFMDAGIDTGPILRRYEFPDAARSPSLTDLRHRLIAFGIERLGEVVADLHRGSLSATPQPPSETDRQFFVMHHLLRARAAEILNQSHAATALQATSRG